MWIIDPFIHSAFELYPASLLLCVHLSGFFTNSNTFVASSGRYVHISWCKYVSRVLNDNSRSIKQVYISIFDDDNDNDDNDNVGVGGGSGIGSGDGGGGGGMYISNN